MVITYALLSLTGFALYVMLGYTFARLRLPWMWKAARRMNRGYAYDSHMYRQSVKQQLTFTMIIWPIYLPVSLSIQAFLVVRRWFKGGPQGVMQRTGAKIGTLVRRHLDELVEKSFS